MSLHEYRFRSTWLLPTPADLVFGAVTDVGGYPHWWPDVRTVQGISADTAELVCRASLPYQIVVQMRRVEEDRIGGRMSVLLTGDLDGILRARVRQAEGCTRLEIAQDVVAVKRLLRWLAPVARPAFLVNHARMMSRGERGLRAHLIG